MGRVTEPSTNTATVTVFGADWCPDCRRSKRLLDRLAVPYLWRDTEHDDEALREMLDLNGGRQSIPVVRLPDGQLLTEPSDPALRRALESAGLLPG
jgi:mycoredoxin